MSPDALHVDPQLSVTSPAGPPSFRLYSPRQILAASLLGSALAGAILYALNERALGRHAQAWLAIVLGVVVTAAVMALSYALGDHAHGLSFIGHVLGFGVWDAAKRQFTEPYRAHLAAGGKPGGNGSVVLITLGSVALLLGIAFATLFVAQPYGEQLKVGGNSVYYQKGVTRADAQKIADALLSDNYFSSDGHSDVQLRREGDGWTLVLITRWVHPTPDQLREFQILSQELADQLAPQPIELALSDDDLEIKTRVTRRPRVVVDKAVVYWLDGATAAEAHQLIDVLVKTEIIKTSDPHRFELRHDGKGFSVSLPIKDGMWDDPKVIASFAEIAGAVTKGMGKAVRYRLCDSTFTLHRTVP